MPNWSVDPLGFSGGCLNFLPPLEQLSRFPTDISRLCHRACQSCTCTLCSCDGRRRARNCRCDGSDRKGRGQCKNPASHSHGVLLLFFFQTNPFREAEHRIVWPSTTRSIPGYGHDEEGGDDLTDISSRGSDGLASSAGVAGTRGLRLAAPATSAWQITHISETLPTQLGYHGRDSGCAHLWARRTQPFWVPTFKSLNGDFESMPASLGRPSTRSETMLRMTSSDPPAMRMPGAPRSN